MGEVLAEIIHEDGRVEKNIRIRFPAGHRSMPKETPQTDGHDMLSMQAGRFLEIFALSVRKVTSALDRVKKLVSGESQFYSLGDKPNGISLTDDKFLVGLRAEKAAARTDDEVGAGSLTVLVAMASTPVPTVTLTLTYQDAGTTPGAPTVLGPFVFLGTTVMSPGTYKIAFKGKIGKGSKLVFIE